MAVIVGFIEVLFIITLFSSGNLAGLLWIGLFGLIFWLCLRSSGKRPKKHESSKAISQYGTTITVLGSSLAEELGNNLKSKDEDKMELQLMAYSFCLLLTTHHFKNAQVSPSRAGEVTKELIKVISSHISQEGYEDEAFENLLSYYQEILSKYGNMSISNQSDKKMGTLLWEYPNDLINVAKGKNTKDISLTLQATSMLTNMIKALEPKKFVTSFK